MSRGAPLESPAHSASHRAPRWSDGQSIRHFTSRKVLRSGQSKVKALGGFTKISQKKIAPKVSRGVPLESGHHGASHRAPNYAERQSLRHFTSKRVLRSGQSKIRRVPTTPSLFFSPKWRDPPTLLSPLTYCPAVLYARQEKFVT